MIVGDGGSGGPTRMTPLITNPAAVNAVLAIQRQSVGERCQQLGL
jgi:hypothetical protein